MSRARDSDCSDYRRFYRPEDGFDVALQIISTFIVLPDFHRIASAVNYSFRWYTYCLDNLFSRYRGQVSERSVVSAFQSKFSPNSRGGTV